MTSRGTFLGGEVKALSVLVMPCQWAINKVKIEGGGGGEG